MNFSFAELIFHPLDEYVHWFGGNTWFPIDSFSDSHIQRKKMIIIGNLADSFDKHTFCPITQRNRKKEIVFRNGIVERGSFE